MPRKLLRTLVAGLVLACLPLPSTTMAGEQSWFVEFRNNTVTPVSRDDTTQLVSIGTVSTDGFKELVITLGAEFKSGTPSKGRVGALLVPDTPMFRYLFENEGKIVFPLEVSVDANGTPVVISQQEIARIAFPRYRVYLYNETESTAQVGFFVYRSR